jgi:chromosome segregation ATPase
MTTTLRRIIGTVLTLTAIGGLVLSLYSLQYIWRLKPGMAESLTDLITLASDTLEATSAGLALTEESLSGVVDSLQALQSALTTTSQTISSTDPMLATAVEMLDEELPKTIRATQASLDSAQASARVIDSFLSVISRIPFINVNYDPEKPLNESLGEISESLDQFPAAFTDFSKSMNDARDDLEVLQADLEMMRAAIGQIESSLEESEGVIAQYQETVDSIQEHLARLEGDIPAWVNSAVWGATVFLVWMALTQIGLFTQGVDLLRITPVQTAGSSTETPT